MKVEQQPAYLLHARPYSESSLLCDFFTAEHGRITLIAKGARGAVGGGSRSRNRGRLRGVLMPHQELLVSWRGKGQLPILTSAEWRSPATRLCGRALHSGFYLNELLLRLLHRHDSHEKLFAQYHRAVAALSRDASAATGGESAAFATRRILRIFEKKLLEEIGFGAVLDRDAESGERIDAAHRYQYVLEKGPVRVSDAEDAANTFIFSGRTLCALRDEAFANEGELLEAQQLTRMLIERQLGGRALRARRVFAEMKRFAGAVG